MVKGIWKLVTPIISAIIGIYATNTFNVFALLPFVPDEHLFDICITVYFAIADIIIELIAELITKSGNTEATIYPELSIKKCNIIFKRNSAKLRTGRE